MQIFKKIISLYENYYKIPLPRPARRGLFIVYTLWQDLVRCDLIKQAYAMAYVTLLSLIPSIAAVTCVVSLFSPMLGKDGVLLDKIREWLLGNLQQGTGETVTTYIDQMVANLDLTSIGWTSFGAMMATLILLLKQIESALNRIWFVRKDRNMFTRFMYFWTFITLGMGVLAFSIGISGVNLVAVLDATEQVQSDSSVFSFLVPIISGFLFFFCLYKFVPNCTVQTRHASIGAIVASILLHEAGRLYGIYITEFANYQSIYGALAALPLFLMWLYICWIIIFLGSLISWRMQEGFPTEKEDDTVDAAKSPAEVLRNLQIRSALPFSCLVAIYRKFKDGTGNGLSVEELALQLRLPLSWIGEAFDLLESKGYIKQSTRITNSAGQKIPVDAYFPAFPADAVDIGEVQKTLLASKNEWINNWQQDVDAEFKNLFSVIGLDQPVRHGNLNELIN